MQNHYYSYEPREGHGLKHDPISGIVGPRIIGWIGTESVSGEINLAPYSFCSLFNYHPPVIAFSSVGYKDSVRNAIESKVFTWNLASHALAHSMNQSSTMQAVNEFEFAQLTPVDSQLIQAPRVGESQVSIECRVTKHFQMTNYNGEALDTWMVLGEAVAIHIDPKLIKDGIYHCGAAKPLLRGGGAGDYYVINDDTLFDMRRPK